MLPLLLRSRSPVLSSGRRRERSVADKRRENNCLYFIYFGRKSFRAVERWRTTRWAHSKTLCKRATISWEAIIRLLRCHRRQCYVRWEAFKSKFFFSLVVDVGFKLIFISIPGMMRCRTIFSFYPYRRCLFSHESTVH